MIAILSVMKKNIIHSSKTHNFPTVQIVVLLGWTFTTHPEYHHHYDGPMAKFII